MEVKETTQDDINTAENAALKAEFEAKISEKDLMDFKVYHNYHSVSGAAALLFGVIALVICIISIRQVNISYTLMMGFFGLFFTVYTPIGMKLKVRQQMKTIAAFQEPMKYTVTEEKIMLTQGDVSEDLSWDDIFKIKCTGKSLVLYITAVRANIIPLGCLGLEAENFMTIAEKKLKPFQMKFDRAKAIARAEQEKRLK